MLTGSRLRESTALFAVVYGQCCANKSTGRAKDDACTIINNGRMPSSLILGYSRCQKPINWRANPDVETTNWRARRGKTAHRVRREGTVRAVSYPYPTIGDKRVVCRDFVKFHEPRIRTTSQLKPISCVRSWLNWEALPRWMGLFGVSISQLREQFSLIIPRSAFSGRQLFLRFHRQ